MRQNNYDPTKWAQDQKNKVERARQLREDRKLGKGALPMDQPQENYRQKFNYNDPVTDDQIKQAQNSLQLLKQKMARTKQSCFGTYEFFSIVQLFLQSTINENLNYDQNCIPESNSYNPNFQNQKQMSYQQYSSQMQQNYPEQKPKNNYRKVFNPNMEVDALDQEIQNLNKQIGNINSNIQQKAQPQQSRQQYTQQIYSNPLQNAGNTFLQEKGNLNYEQKPPIKKIEKKPLHHLSKYDDEQDNIYKGAFAYNPDEYMKQQIIEEKNRGEQKSKQKQKVQKVNDFNTQEEQQKINENTCKYGNYKYNDQEEFPEQTYQQQPQKNKAINKYDNYSQQDKQQNNSRNPQNQGYTSSQSSQMNNQPSKFNSRNKVQQQQSQSNQGMSSYQNKQKPLIGKDNNDDNRPAFGYFQILTGIGNQLDLNQEDENEPIVQCKQGCGRSFKVSVLAKHEAICKKVFQKKRKVFDSQKNRIIDEQHEQLLQEQIYMKKKKPQGKQQQQQQKGDKKSKWRMQSEAFRAMLKIGKGDELSQKDQAKMNQYLQEQDTRLQCQWCGRKFNENAYNKHIIICENNFKKTQSKNNQPRARNKKY